MCQSQTIWLLEGGFLKETEFPSLEEITFGWGVIHLGLDQWGRGGLPAKYSLVVFLIIIIIILIYFHMFSKKGHLKMQKLKMHRQEGTLQVSMNIGRLRKFVVTVLSLWTFSISFFSFLPLVNKRWAYASSTMRCPFC